MSDSFNTTAANWQGTTDNIEMNSKDLAESGAVFNEINKKINATDSELPTEIGTFETIRIPLPNIKKGDKLIARYKPLTSLKEDGISLSIKVTFFYGNSYYSEVVPQYEYILNKEYFFEYDVIRDISAAPGLPKVDIYATNFGGTFELELFKYVSIKDELENKQDKFNFASISDFTNRTEEGDSKIPSVGVILNGSDNKPILGSNNLVKSGGVFNEINKKVSATDSELPTEIDTFENIVVPLQHINKGDKLIARFKPLTNINSGTSLGFLIRFLYSGSDNTDFVIPGDYYGLNNEYYFEYDVIRDCAEGYPKAYIYATNFGGTFELELFKNVSLKDEIEKKQDKLVSGQNIKTVNGLSLLGSGNVNTNGGSLSGKKILWLGTSIPQGSLSDKVTINGYTGYNNYPEMVGHLLGCTVYNEAVGGSRIAASSTPEEYNAETNPIALADGKEAMFPFYSSLGATIKEKDYLYDNWAALYQRFTDGVATPPVTKAQMEAFSFEKKVIDKYISDNPSVSKVDVIFLDHGFNDRGSTVFDTTPKPYSVTERFYFKGAMAYLIRKIFEANSRAHIVIGSVYNDMDDPTHKVLAAQKEIAETFSVPFIDYNKLMTIWNGQFVYTRGYWDADSIWHETGFTWQEDSSEKGYTTNDHGHLSSRPKSEWINTYNVHQVTETEDLSNIYPVGTTVYKSPRLPIMVKDNLHPHSDKSGYLNMQIAQYISKQLKEIVGF